MAAYLDLYRTGELQARATAARRRLASCDLCPRCCRVNRLAGEHGACRTGEVALVSSCGPHHGEEAPLRGSGGSGTIFFAECNLRCVYCQNYDISHLGRGRETTAAELARLMLELQDAGCHNINLVSPSHVIAQCLEALVLAAGQGLHVPLVYNTGGYDSVAALALLDGVIDIYLPDMKYGRNSTGERLSGVPAYVDVNRAATQEMRRQAGELQLDERGTAVRGLLVRHLVLPGHLDETESILRFIAAELSVDTWVNIMPQYRPCHRANEFPPLDRRLAVFDWQEARRLAAACGLRRVLPG